jgi:alpha/beta superfamily hydrolase
MNAHRKLTIDGPAGPLEALFWNIERDGGAAAMPPPFAALVCHPHPLFGGTMQNKVVYRAAKALHGLGLPVLRFNFRGVRLSAGTYDRGNGEQDDVHAALDFLAANFPGAPLLVAGFSFGAWVGLRVGCVDARVTALVGLGLPVGDVDVSYLSECAKPKLLMSGDQDQYGPKEKLEAIISALPEKSRTATQLILVPGADHFFAGHLGVVESAIPEWVGARMEDPR